MRAQDCKGSCLWATEVTHLNVKWQLWRQFLFQRSLCPSYEIQHSAVNVASFFVYLSFRTRSAVGLLVICGFGIFECVPCNKCACLGMRLKETELLFLAVTSASGMSTLPWGPWSFWDWEGWRTWDAQWCSGISIDVGRACFWPASQCRKPPVLCSWVHVQTASEWIHRLTYK